VSLVEQFRVQLDVTERLKLTSLDHISLTLSRFVVVSRKFLNVAKASGSAVSLLLDQGLVRFLDRRRSGAPGVDIVDLEGFFDLTRALGPES